MEMSGEREREMTATPLETPLSVRYENQWKWMLVVMKLWRLIAPAMK